MRPEAFLVSKLPADVISKTDERFISGDYVVAGFWKKDKTEQGAFVRVAGIDLQTPALATFSRLEYEGPPFYFSVRHAALVQTAPGTFALLEDGHLGVEWQREVLLAAQLIPVASVGEMLQARYEHE